MIEQLIEKKIVDRMSELLSAYNIQIYGTLQPSIFEKAEEQDEDDEGNTQNGVLVVKVSPREYQTPTTPDCTIRCGISLSLRADVDYNGETYLGVCDKIMDELEDMQRCMDDVHERYKVKDFEPTGFQLESGDTNVEQDTKIWSYTHGFTIYGIVAHE